MVVSSKDDLMQYVMERRWGPKALLDLRPLKSPVYPEGVVPNIYDPTVTIDSPYEAPTVAETIMQMSTVGLGSGLIRSLTAGYGNRRPPGRWRRFSSRRRRRATARAWTGF